MACCLEVFRTARVEAACLNSLFMTAFFASRSAVSFPFIPLWLGTQVIVILALGFSFCRVSMLEMFGDKRKPYCHVYIRRIPPPATRQTYSIQCSYTHHCLPRNRRWPL